MSDYGLTLGMRLDKKRNKYYVKNLYKTGRTWACKNYETIGTKNGKTKSIKNKSVKNKPLCQRRGKIQVTEDTGRSTCV
jgi:hypothetical protein